MRICIVTDEISADLETALELGTSWDVHDFELRGFYTDRVPQFSAYQKQRVRELMEQFRARFVAISPGLFKFPYPPAERERFSLSAIDALLYNQWRDARNHVAYHLEELLPASIDYAQELGARQIVVFGFSRGGLPPGRAPDEVLETLRRAAEMAAGAGLRLAVEVEEGFWADTGERAAAMVRAINHPALGINWDPGNAIVAGDVPYPDGYEAAREYVRHVHFKDVVRKPRGRYRYAVVGDIDWKGQIRALAQDSFDGYIAVETHMQPKVASAKAALDRLRSLIAEAAVSP